MAPLARTNAARFEANSGRFFFPVEDESAGPERARGVSEVANKVPVIEGE